MKVICYELVQCVGICCIIVLFLSLQSISVARRPVPGQMANGLLLGRPWFTSHWNLVALSVISDIHKGISVRAKMMCKCNAP